MITGQNQALQIHLYYALTDVSGDPLLAWKSSRLDAAYCLDAPDAFPAGGHAQWRFDYEYLPIEMILYREA